MKIQITEVVQDKEKPWNVLKATLASRPKCKTCNKNERREGGVGLLQRMCGFI